MHEFGASHPDGTIDVRFTAREADPAVDVYLDIDFLLREWPRIAHLRLEGDRERSVVVRLPVDVELTYRFLRWRGPEPLGDDIPSLWTLLGSAEADPDVEDGIFDAFGFGVGASVLVGPAAAPPHPVWASGRDIADAEPSRVELEADGHRATLLHAANVERVAVFLDGGVWLGSLHLGGAMRRGGSPGTAFVVVPTPDRAVLADRPRMAALVADGLLPQVETVLGRRIDADRVGVAGQSFGGLAAAGVVVDRPDRVSTGIVSSGSFWWRVGRDTRDEPEPGELTESLVDTDLTGTRFLLHVGREERTMIGQSESFAAAARARGAVAEVDVHPGGHDYAWYRHAVFGALDRWAAAG